MSWNSWFSSWCRIGNDMLFIFCDCGKHVSTLFHFRYFFILIITVLFLLLIIVIQMKMLHMASLPSMGMRHVMKRHGSGSGRGRGRRRGRHAAGNDGIDRGVDDCA